ncbi:MAG TPA: toll/interleukin-1 receptor domain-containing protein [Pyrinomonadaceae bacterium]|nr:toll/interleukin-1 receptor domain-containing protein [Pyrinomonadaceae bacterium]
MLTSPTDLDRVEIFISYSHEDEALLKRLETHLTGLKRAGLITVWHGRKISAGVPWEEEIDKYLSNAQIVLLLVSANFIASDYCYGVEFQRAMERHKQRTARVIAVILSPCRWRDTPLAKLQVSPRGANPVTQWVDTEQAFVSIADDIAEVVKELRLINPKDAERENPSDGQESNVVKRPNRPKFIKEAIRTIPAIKYTLALAITVAMIAIAGFMIDNWRRVSLPIPCPSPTPSPEATATPSPRVSVMPQGIKITISEFPPYNPVGGPDSMGHIAGNVAGSGREEYSIVIYSYTNLWYVQPSTEKPRTAIDRNGNWSAEIKTGTKYAVLLVPQSYQPPNKTSTNPTNLDPVITFMEVEGKNVLRIRQKRNAVIPTTKNGNTSQ